MLCVVSKSGSRLCGFLSHLCYCVRVSAPRNDALLLFAFLYSSSDIFVEWGAFASCSKPIHYWLLGSYVAVIAFRLSHYLGQYLSDVSNATVCWSVLLFSSRRLTSMWRRKLICVELDNCALSFLCA